MSHNDEPGFTFDDYAAATAAFADAITATISEPDNVAAVKEEFYRWAEQAYNRGTFAVSVERLIADHLWSRLNGNAGSATRKMLDDIDAGKIGMPLEVWLDQPLTAGKHRRILIRHYTPADGQRMIAERRENEEKARAKRIEVEAQVKRLDEYVIGYGSLPAALQSGALVLREAAE
jgi:hypothetical protein